MEAFKHLRHAERSTIHDRTLGSSSGSRQGSRRVAALHAAMAARVDAAAAVLGRAMRSTMHANAERANSADRQLRAVGPAQVLDRGYSVTLDAEGKAVRKPSDVAPGERLRTLLTEGEITSWSKARSHARSCASSFASPGVRRSIPRPICSDLEQRSR